MATASLNFNIIEKRMMNEAEAAGYCGLPAKHFRTICPVQPLELANRCLRYDRRDLDQWIDNEKAGTAETSQSAILGRLE